MTTFQEGSILQLTDLGYSVVTANSGLDEEKIQEFREGAPTLAVYFQDPVVLLCFQFGAFDFQIAPFYRHMNPLSEVPQAAGRERIPLVFSLWEALTENCKVVRSIIPGPQFCDVFTQAVNKQIAAIGADETELKARLQKTLAALPRSNDALLGQAVISWTGGKRDRVQKR